MFSNLLHEMGVGADVGYLLMTLMLLCFYHVYAVCGGEFFNSSLVCSAVYKIPCVIILTSALILTKYVPVSTNMVHGNVPNIDRYWYTENVLLSTDTSTQKVFQYRPILVHEKCTSIDVPVSTDTGTLLSYYM